MDSGRQPLKLDPILETAGLWQDFHTSFITALRDWLRRDLRDRYVTMAEERVYVTWEGSPVPAVYRPDVAVSARESPAHDAPAPGPPSP